MEGHQIPHIPFHYPVLITLHVRIYNALVLGTHRDEDRDKPAESCAKSVASSDDSTRRRTSSSNDSVLSESAASGYSSPPLLADVPWPPNVTAAAAADRHSVSSPPPHHHHHHHAVADAPIHEVLETTVWSAGTLDVPPRRCYAVIIPNYYLIVFNNIIIRCVLRSSFEIGF